MCLFGVHSELCSESHNFILICVGGTRRSGVAAAHSASCVHLDGRLAAALGEDHVLQSHIRPYSADPVIKKPDYVDVLVMSSLSDFYLGALHISVLLKCKQPHYFLSLPT